MKTKLAVLFVGAVLSVVVAQGYLTNTIILPEGETWLPVVNCETNAWMPDKTPYSIEAMRASGEITNIVETLADNGEICKVYGHQWQSIPHVTLEYYSDGNYPMHRRCKICGKTETKKEVWE